MKKQIRQTENLDEIGIRLIKSASLKDEEIEKIVSRQNLFKMVAAKIESEKRRREENDVFAAAPGLGWRKIALSFGVPAVLATALSGWLFLNKSDSRSVSTSENFDYSEKISAAVSAEKMPPKLKYAVENTKPSVSTAESKKEERRLVVKKEIERRTKPLRKERLSPRKHSKQIEDEDVFYPLNFAGNFNSEDSRQIVRVELSRDSLAALGVNLPIGDENEKVAADLLVGSDGLPQAFRFVKNFKTF